MTSVSEAFSVVLSKSFDWKLWLYLAVIILIGLIAIMVPFFVLFFIALMVFALVQFSFLALLLYFILFILFMLISLIVGSAMNGTALNLAREYLAKGTYDLWKAWHKTKSRIFTSVKVEIIVSVFFFFLFLICFIPFFFSLIGFFNSLSLPMILFSSPENWLSLFASLFASLIVSFLIWIIVSIVLLPFTALYRQVPFFESLGAVDSIHRTIDLAKKNYKKTLFFALLFFIVFLGITFLYLILSLSFGVTSLFPTLGALIALLMIFRLIIELFYTVWITTFSYLFDTQIYLLNIENEKTPFSKKGVTKTALRKPAKSVRKKKKT